MKKLPIFLVFLFLFIFPSGIFASFSGGINIGDHYSEIDNAANASNGTGWVYVIMNPDNASQLSSWLNKYPNLQMIVRGHVPDQRGSSLTSEYAQRWANVFKNLPRAIYFMPVNEPNNPAESNGGIPAVTVISYITSLTNAINNTAGAKEKVVLLSPAIDVYTLSDRGSSYISELGGWSFFSQFYGIALNLYGEYAGSSINPNAPPIKRGEGYREFLKPHFDANEAQASSTRIFAVETGVKKVGENVKYRENAAEIADYFNRMRILWGSDPNFIMHAVFSYDPINNANPPWIYTETAVLAAMGLTGGTTSVIASPTPELEDFQKEYEITKNANKRLLPKSIQDVIAQKETNNCALNILGICFIGRSTKEKLVVQTEHFQPVFVTKDKVVSAEKNCENLGCVINNVIKNLFGLVVPPQIEVKETGSLNAFRPQNLEFSQINNQTAQDNSNQNVLAATVAPLTEEERVKNTYTFTQKMLLPRSIGNLIAQAPTPTLAQGVPTPTSITPTPPGANTSLKDNYGSNALKNLFSEVGTFYGVPPAVIAAVSWIEGNNVWRYNDSQIVQYSIPSSRDPFWTRGNTCSMNACSAAGPMQMTLGTQAAYNYGYSRGDICVGCMGHQRGSVGYYTCILNPFLSLPNAWEGYKNSVREAPGESGRNPLVCNIKDSFWGAAKKLKTDSRTSGISLTWDKEAVANAGWRYYGACGRCNNSQDPELSKGSRNQFACDRLGMSYCEYMWRYYQCNERSTSASDFAACATSDGLDRIRF